MIDAVDTLKNDRPLRRPPYSQYVNYYKGQKPMNTMPELNTGTYGAKVQSWRAANPRDLLKGIRADNPRADKPRLLSLFEDKVMASTPAYLSAIIEYWFSNNYASLVERSSAARAEGVAQRERIEGNMRLGVKAAIKREAMILLSTMLPNGKALRDTTFGECAKMGGVLSRIATKGKPKQIVGTVLSDAELRGLQAP